MKKDIMDTHPDDFLCTHSRTDLDSVVQHHIITARDKWQSKLMEHGALGIKYDKDGKTI